MEFTSIDKDNVAVMTGKAAEWFLKLGLFQMQISAYNGIINGHSHIMCIKDAEFKSNNFKLSPISLELSFCLNR